MSVYNNSKYLPEAIKSILNQTFSNFEFLIINDGSTDSSVDIINSFNDTRIHLVHNNSNLGLTKSLNKGIKLANGKYILRMDADDISLTNRIERQVEFMENNPKIAVCGCWANIVDEYNNIVNIKKYVTSSEEIKVRLFLVENALGHPGVIMRKNIVKHYFYNEEYPYSQDYELWVRLAKSHLLSNIPEPLINYRFHDQTISKSKKREQRDLWYQIIFKQMEELTNQEISIQEKRIWISVVEREIHSEIDTLKLFQNLLQKLYQANKKNNTYDFNILKQYLMSYNQLILLLFQRITLIHFFYFLKSPFISSFSWFYILKLFLKSLIFKKQLSS